MGYLVVVVVPYQFVLGRPRPAVSGMVLARWGYSSSQLMQETGQRSMAWLWISASLAPAGS
ncbi:hypothetical protein GMST_40310 [Geomonas silvestris]|uniref:Uncharacterized protein n=1 Tax=Geomonas silvestris TaxID=2740184 RepID=A0A6V8MNS5_9BACT|nr:hypothetical protein GMST_40310 [Geomonas silvestris]